MQIELSDLFLGNTMYSLFGPVILIVVGYIVTKRDPPLGIFFFMLDAVICYMYADLVAATPFYFWHIIFLVLGMITCSMAMASKR